MTKFRQSALACLHSAAFGAKTQKAVIFMKIARRFVRKRHLLLTTVISSRYNQAGLVTEQCLSAANKLEVKAFPVVTRSANQRMYRSAFNPSSETINKVCASVLCRSLSN